MNREQVKNPHLIYPGDVLVLSQGPDGRPQLSVDRSTVRLSPTVRVESLAAEAVPSIPSADIEPFLMRPIITGADGLPSAGKIIGAKDNRVIRGDGDMVYAVDIAEAGGNQWSIYRPGKVLRSFDSNEVLGYEMRNLGAARVERFGEVSTIRITSAREEILLGDLLVPSAREELINYVPHAPDKTIEGRVIDLAQDAHETGRGYVVTLDRGARDGLEIGHVLAIYHPAPVIADPRPYEGPDVLSKLTEQTRVILPPTRYLNIPAERSGLLFVFRVFDRVAYALVLNVSDPVVVGDLVRRP